MQLIQENPDLSAYLAADEVIDHDHPQVRRTAARLAGEVADSYAYAQAAYEFVRDTIPHSADSGDPRVTWRASDVLERRTGICYAKAHALAALLRAEDIPTALCYQRLVSEGADTPCTGWSRSASTVPGTGRTRAATSPEWTPGSHWTASGSPGSRTPRPARRTIPCCTRHRTRRSWPRCAAPRPGPAVAEPARRPLRGAGGVEPSAAQRASAARSASCVGAVPPRCAGTHQVSSGSLGRTG